MLCPMPPRFLIFLTLLVLGAGFAPARAQDGVAAVNPLVSQAKARIDQRRYDEAAELYRRALDILEKDPDRNRPYLIDTLSNLARTYEFQSRYVDALELRKRAVALGEATSGRDKGLGLANSLNDLGMAYALLGRLAEAEPLNERALMIRESALGKNHRDVAVSLNNLARIYERLGRYEDAAALHRRAIAIEEKAPGRAGSSPSASTTWRSSTSRSAARMRPSSSRNVPWRCSKRRFRRTTPIWRRASTTWPSPTGNWGTLRKASRCSSGPSPSRSRSSDPTILRSPSTSFRSPTPM